MQWGFCPRGDKNPVLIEPMHQVRKTQNWLINIANGMYGEQVMWGDQGMLLWSPHGQSVIHTDLAMYQVLRQHFLSKNFIKKYFIFHKNWMKPEMIRKAKKYFKGYRLSKENNLIGYLQAIKSINEMFIQCEKLEHLEWWPEAIIEAGIYHIYSFYMFTY